MAIMGDDSIMKIGSCGVGTIGSWEWDDKGHANVAQIFISHDYDSIKSIQFQYVDAETGTISLSERHGTTTTIAASRFDVVKLNHPHEYITRVSGYVWCKNDGSICRISFNTNHEDYGPFGYMDYMDPANSFCINLGPDPLQFHGFYGTADNDGLKSIGLYLNLNPN